MYYALDFDIWLQQSYPSLYEKWQCYGYNMSCQKYTTKNNPKIYEKYQKALKNGKYNVAINSYEQD
jgi:hypothetical protein